MKLKCTGCVVLLHIVVLCGIARADGAPPDGGVPEVPPDAPPDAAEPPPDAPPAQETPSNVTPPSDEQATPDEGGKKKKKKKKKKHDEAGGDEFDSNYGDIVAGDDLRGVSTHGVNFRFLLQTKYQTTLLDKDLDPAATLDPRIGDGYSINRAFLRATSNPYPWLRLKFLADFAEFSHKTPKRALKLAYAEFTPIEHVILTVGLFKRTYSLLELLPIADFELTDVGPTDVLIKDAELGGRDPGAMIRVSPFDKKKKLNIFLGVFDGGLGGPEARPYGLMTARIETVPIKHVRLGIDGAWRPHGLPAPAPGVAPSTGPGRAIAADATYSRKKLELRAEWLWGNRTDEANAGAAHTWMALWAIGAVKIPIADNVQLMPAARFEWLDADREHPIGRRFLMTGALNLMDLEDSLRLLIDVSRSQVQSGTYPLSLPPILLDTSSTVITVQVQVKV